MAVLVPCLVRLRSQFNALNELRDKASDGWIGDPDHQSRDSDHNPDSRGIVHALDVDETGPWPRGLTMRAMVGQIVADCRAGREARLTYVIYERTIWSASRDWKPRDYTGSSPHDKHAHFSADDLPSRENDVRPFRLEAPPVATDLTADAVKDVVAAVIRADVDWSGKTYSLAGAVFDAKKFSEANGKTLTSVLAKQNTLLQEVGQLRAQVSEVVALLRALGPIPPAGPVSIDDPTR
jgi:hypothetical protein